MSQIIHINFTTRKFIVRRQK